MNKRRFLTQKEAENYYGHTWRWIEKNMYVQRCYTSQGFQGYFVSKK